MKRFALRGGTAFVVFKGIKISLDFFGSFFHQWKKGIKTLILSKV